MTKTIWQSLLLQATTRVVKLFSLITHLLDHKFVAMAGQIGTDLTEPQISFVMPNTQLLRALPSPTPTRRIASRRVPRVSLRRIPVLSSIPARNPGGIICPTNARIPLSSSVPGRGRLIVRPKARRSLRQGCVDGGHRDAESDLGSFPRRTVALLHGRPRAFLFASWLSLSQARLTWSLAT